MPIFKNGSKFLAANYKPISVLSNINTLFETIIHAHIWQASLTTFNYTALIGMDFERDVAPHVPYCISFKLYLMPQSWSNVTSNITRTHKSIWLCPSLYFFLNRRRNGFRGNFLSLMKSYLQNRTQNFYIGVKLNELIVQHREPQGYLLFLL